MDPTSSQVSHWTDRIQAIDARLAMRCAPLSWQVVQALLRHTDSQGGQVSRPVQARLAWHVQQVEQKISHPSAWRQPITPAAPIPWPAQALKPVQPLAAWADMRQWHARFQIRHQLQRSLAQPLQHAGPLHSERLVQQSLSLLNGLSAAYLHRFLSHVDALAALEDAVKPRTVKPKGQIAKSVKAAKASLKPPT